MTAIYFVLTVCAVLAGHQTMACYQHCSASFNHKIQRLVGISDTATLTSRSCQAMSEQMLCLEGKKTTCDNISLQYVNTILNFIRPDYERTCALSSSDGDNTTQVLGRMSQAQCAQQVQHCTDSFNSSFSPATSQAQQNVTAICQSLDNYTMCVEDLIPECGQYIGQSVRSIRTLQQQFSSLCSETSSPQSVTQCVNDTMDCFEEFNSTFIPARKEYMLVNICSAMDRYSLCLNHVHAHEECQRYTQHALVGLLNLKQQYSMYCGPDGGVQAQKCLTDFQQCYTAFNLTYFPAMHHGNMAGICRSVSQYASCVQPLYDDCGFHMSQALGSVRVLKEQFALQCNPEFQRLSSCAPLAACLNDLPSGFSPGSSSTLCTQLASYFPCVESSLKQCNIPPEDTSVDFSQLGSLIGAYCQHLLGNRVLGTCPNFVSCVGGIVLVSTPDPSAMFDADTWCSYMTMSLKCVDRAVNTVQCGLSNDDTILGHLKQQLAHKHKICKQLAVPSLNPSHGKNTTGDHNHHHPSHGSDGGHTGATRGAAVRVTTHLLPTILCVAHLLPTVVSLLLQRWL